MNDYVNTIERGNIPLDYWLLLQYSVMNDFDKIRTIANRVNNEGKELIAVYPGIPEMMQDIDVSEMEFVGDIIDGALYLK